MSEQLSITHADVGEAVRSTAVLADITISMWGGERTDADLMAKVRADAGAVGNVGRVIKNMLAGADGSLKEVKSAFNAVRMEHYAMTLPWVADPHAMRATGARLLPNVLFDQYLKVMGTRRRVALQTLDKFIAEYPDLVVRARTNLGNMADLTYPTPEDVRAQFRIGFDFEPIPSGHTFKGLPDALLHKLSKSLHEKQERMIAAANAAMWETVRERVARLAERMSDPEAKFRESTVENLRDLIVLLPGWNLAGDARAAEITEDITRMLAGVDAKALRDKTDVRKDVAEQARNVVDKLSQWNL